MTVRVRDGDLRVLVFVGDVSLAQYAPAPKR